MGLETNKAVAAANGPEISQQSGGATISLKSPLQTSSETLTKPTSPSSKTAPSSEPAFANSEVSHPKPEVPIARGVFSTPGFKPPTKGSPEDSRAFFLDGGLSLNPLEVALEGVETFLSITGLSTDPEAVTFRAKGHRKATRRAIRILRGEDYKISWRMKRAIMKGNVGQDTPTGQTHKEYHCDAAQTYQDLENGCLGYIERLEQEIAKAARMPVANRRQRIAREKKIGMLVGKLLHAAQDFYSHVKPYTETMAKRQGYENNLHNMPLGVAPVLPQVRSGDPRYEEAFEEFKRQSPLSGTFKLGMGIENRGPGSHHEMSNDLMSFGKGAKPYKQAFDLALRDTVYRLKRLGVFSHVTDEEVREFIISSANN